MTLDHLSPSTSSRLRLRLDADDDGTGELFVDVVAGPYSGASSAWFDVQSLRDFAAALRTTYPIDSSAPLTLEGGFWSKSGDGLDQLHVGLAFYPIGVRGVVGCRVVLCTPRRQDQRADSQCSASVELQTVYSALADFAHAFDGLTKGLVEEAVLSCERID